MSEIPLHRATVDGARAAVEVRETRKKDNVMKPSARANTARKFDTQHVSARPAVIPRLDRERFQRMLREYEKNRVPASEMLNGDVVVGNETVDLADINRFVNPRAALEAQGIPVHAAGSTESPAPGSVTVPLSQEKNDAGATPSAPLAAPAR
jgi:hypothetical protein